MLERDVQYFLAIAKVPTLTRAAESLGISQPALSRAVQRLEERYGLALLERTARGVALSEAGRRFAVRAGMAANAADDAQSELMDLAAGAKGEVRVAAGVTIAHLVTDALIPRFITERPAATLLLDLGFNDELITRLGEGDYDFAICAVPQALDDHLEARFLVEDRLVPMVRRGHVLAGRKLVRAKDLLQYPWAIPHRLAESRRRLNQGFARLSLPTPRATVETNSYEQALAVAARSDCICLAPLWHAQRGLGIFASLAPLDVRELVDHRNIGFVTRKSGYLSILALRAAELIEEAILSAYTKEPPRRP